MPPTEKKVPADKIAVIEQWIAAGAAVGRDEPESLPAGIDITPEERAFWSFQPIKRPNPPQLAKPSPTRRSSQQQPGGRHRPHADRRLCPRAAARQGPAVRPRCRPAHAHPAAPRST